MDKIRQLAGVEQVIRVAKPPMDQMHLGFGGGGLKGSDEKPIDISLHYGDADYVPFYGMKLVAGRNMLPAIDCEPAGLVLHAWLAAGLCIPCSA